MNKCKLYFLEGSLVDLTTRLITNLSHLTLLQTNVFQNDSDTESVTELISTNAGKAHYDTSLPSNSNNNTELSRSDHHQNLQVPRVLPSAINFTDIENILRFFSEH